MQYVETVGVSKTSDGLVEIVSRRRYADGISYEATVYVDTSGAAALADALGRLLSGGHGDTAQVGDQTIEVFEGGSDMDPTVAVAVDVSGDRAFGGYRALDCSRDGAAKLSAELQALA